MAEKVLTRPEPSVDPLAPARADLGRRLKKARKAAQLTQAKVGETLALEGDHSAVGQWERGNTLLGTVNLILCAQLYRASLDWLVFGMKGKLEERIDALPDELREGVMQQVMTAISNAEGVVKRRPELFQKENVVRDDDERLTRWSAAGKTAKRRPAKKRRTGPGTQ